MSVIQKRAIPNAIAWIIVSERIISDSLRK